MTYRLALAAVTAAIALLVAAPSALAGKGMEVAVQDDAVLVGLLWSSPDIGLDLAGQLNATRIRVNVPWADVIAEGASSTTKPDHIEYNWTGYDAIVESARKRGMQVQMALTGIAPAFATSNHRPGNVKPKAALFAEFARDAATHFRGKVNRYSIWNEPNYVSWLSPLKSAAKVYRKLYSSGYKAIKAADPGAQVLIAETSPFGIKKRATPPLKFLRDVTCANRRYKRARKCAKLVTDGFAHHPYDFRHKITYKYPGKDNVTLSTLGRLTSALSKLRKAKLLSTPKGGVPFLYLTEYGYFARGKYKLSEKKRGSYLVKAFTIAQKNKRVKQLLQYLLVQPSNKYRFFDTSLATREGKVGKAFQKLAAWAQKAGKAGKIIVPQPPPPEPPPPPPPPPPPCTLPPLICP